MTKKQKKDTIIPVLLPTPVSSVSQALTTTSASVTTSSKNPDFVLVWNGKDNKAMSEKAFERRSIFEYNLGEEGLILEWETSKSSPDLHVVKIWAPLEVLKRYSEILKLRLPMKALAVQITESKRRRRFSKSIESIRKSSEWTEECCITLARCCNMDEPVTTESKYRKLTGVFSRDREYLFDLDESNVEKVFPLFVRARIVQFILSRTPFKAGEDLERDAFAFGYERLIQQDIYDACYPLHDGDIKTEGCARKLLHDHWGTVSACFRVQPLDIIKDYYGVNIALYFAWLGYYTRMLLFAATIGLICFLYGLLTVSSDQFVNDVCNETTDVVMCPLCDRKCGYWNLSEKCGYAKFAYLFDNEFSFVFSLAMSVWAAIFLELWKRYTARIAYHWDLTSFDLKKDFNPRPEYVAELKKAYPAGINPNNAKPEEQERTSDTSDHRRFDFELSIPFWQKVLPFRILSYSTVLLLVIMAMAAVAGVILYRLWFSVFLYTNVEEEEMGFGWQKFWISLTAASLNLTFIFIFNKLYKKIAKSLTEFEYPRTQFEYEASYTLKIYVLQFINNYSSIFYVAFFKGSYTGAPHRYVKLVNLRQEECGLGCMPELCIQLVVIMVGKQAKNIIVGATLPLLTRAFKKLKRKLKVASTNDENKLADERDSGSQWARDYDLLNWGSFSLIDEYLEMVLQFGFVTIFVVAFPLAPLFALINNILELRLDANKMLTHFKRPVGFRAKDIGIWSDIIDGIVKIAVITNACIIALTSNFIPKFMYRFILLPKGDPRYGTLVGYLNHSLTTFDTDDLETSPHPAVLSKTGSSKYCSFQTYRYGYNYIDPSLKYDYRLEHWEILLARVVFIIMYQNFVNFVIGLVGWMIPDVPGKLRGQMQREERLVNELIVKQEQRRARGFMASRNINSLSNASRTSSAHAKAKQDLPTIPSTNAN